MAALYEQRSGTVVATEYTRGPWDPNAQHGGAPAALLIGAFEREAPDHRLTISRVTYELLRPVPLGELHVDVEVIRPGRRVQLLDGRITTPDGVEVVRARALRVARAPVTAAAPSAPVPTLPDGLNEERFFGGDMIRFPGDGIEVRFAAGAFGTPGPATAWFRLRVPVLSGERITPLQRLAAASDFPNGIATELDWAEYVFINPDLTLYVEREPEGEWICLDAAMRVHEGGGGVSEAILYDRRGRVGRSVQSLYVAKR
jgi:Thioesterase-like superfamily